MTTDESWGFEEGEEIGAGRSVLKRVGGGSRYEVYLAWDEHLHALVVAKLLRPHLTEDERALHELRREADVLARLSHPVLLRGFGAELEGETPHLVVEHLEGPTLRRLIKRQVTLPLEQLLPVAIHVAAALHYMSAEGFVHLDVKPSNIVMGVPPRLIDLSIARRMERAATLSTAIGTDAYMAPEQCDPIGRPGEIGPPADVWGLGATMHHAASGSVPFPRERAAAYSDDPRVRFPQIFDEPPALAASVPAPLAALIRQMLAFDPAERPGADEVADALEPLVITRPTKKQKGGTALA